MTGESIEAIATALHNSIDRTPTANVRRLSHRQAGRAGGLRARDIAANQAMVKFDNHSTGYTGLDLHIRFRPDPYAQHGCVLSSANVQVECHADSVMAHQSPKHQQTGRSIPLTLTHAACRHK